MASVVSLDRYVRWPHNRLNGNKWPSTSGRSQRRQSALDPWPRQLWPLYVDDARAPDGDGIGNGDGEGVGKEGRTRLRPFVVGPSPLTLQDSLRASTRHPLPWRATLKGSLVFRGSFRKRLWPNSYDSSLVLFKDIFVVFMRFDCGAI